jgi:hypothetical protein
MLASEWAKGKLYPPCTNNFFSLESHWMCLGIWILNNFFPTLHCSAMKRSAPKQQTPREILLFPFLPVMVLFESNKSLLQQNMAVEQEGQFLT